MTGGCVGGLVSCAGVFCSIGEGTGEGGSAGGTGIGIVAVSCLVGIILLWMVIGLG